MQVCNKTAFSILVWGDPLRIYGKALRFLAIAILSVCPSVTRVDQSKTMQARTTKSSQSAVWKSSFKNRKAFPFSRCGNCDASSLFRTTAFAKLLFHPCSPAPSNITMHSFPQTHA